VPRHFIGMSFDGRVGSLARIVSSTYRYKRPPRKKRTVPLTGPAVVTKRASVAEACQDHRLRGGGGLSTVEPKPAPKKSVIVSTAGRKHLKLNRASRRGEDRPEDSGFEKAKWARDRGHDGSAKIQVPVLRWSGRASASSRDAWTYATGVWSTLPAVRGERDASRSPPDSRLGGLADDSEGSPSRRQPMHPAAAWANEPWLRRHRCKRVPSS
jgi:hypothetical protein